MPTAFPSISPSGSRSISLLPRTTVTENQDELTSPAEEASSTVIVCQTAPSPLPSKPPANAGSLDSRRPDERTPVGNNMSPSQVFHRIAEVRAQQGLSLRTISRRTGIEVKELRQQENPNSDLTLSQLAVWQKALEVPLVDLLEDDNQALSRPVKERAKMVRIMKTVVSMCEVSQTHPRFSRLSQMLREQMLDLMPELAEIGGWPQCGSRRGADVMGRIFHEPVSVEMGGAD